MTQNKFGTAIITLKDILSYKFLIPTYQRPYVWDDEQIKSLLDDFHLSFTSNANENYYIGTIITKEESTSNQIELVDGQQRFTTLWLIAYCFKKLNVSTRLTEFLKVGDQMKLSFEIRNEVENYLYYLLNNSSEHIENVYPDVNRQEFVKHIAKAVSTIESYLRLIDEQAGFGDFIFENVHLVKNNTPDNVDLNKIFTTINSSGIQLEQTDIIKSKLLNHLGDEKVLYSKLWEVCENMFSYFEKNVRDSFGGELTKKLDLTSWVAFRRDIFYAHAENREEQAQGLTISDIINNTSIALTTTEETDQKDNLKSDEIYCRSLISFPQLLIHTYRIHLAKESKADFEGTFHANRIIEIFDPLINSNKEEIKRFLELLWDVRQVFDLYIIKWVVDLSTKQESLELVNFNKNSNDYYSKTNYAVDDFHQLQSMLYFTGDYLRQYWLTPYLHFLLENKTQYDKAKALLRLEEIDNELSLTKDKNKNTSFSQLSQDIDYHVDYELYLYQSHGVRFQHYWFQKLEYILWKNWKDREDEKFKRYRISSKNSVEHLNPQTPKPGAMKLKEELLNAFGNLVLLSVTQNSEYSNKYIHVKQAEFNSKNNYDTLKSKLFFDELDDNGDFENLISIHGKQMIENIKKHYNDVRNKKSKNLINSDML
ncbi:DUF262 domain-containing protein [Chryseobacterium culicis]|uniref:DUF262 domain-containing protein n=1 Tax=Chryseobacterium culicis TaxID=680127 RepID=A0A1H6H1L8_CHRCI|nr:DUF262 domain-containing protein [Chryseobacterium culicis]SEH29599.1 Protein of unknown function [Chryseobacterium culicis]